MTEAKDPMGRTLTESHRQLALAALIRSRVHDATPSQIREWARELHDQEFDAGDVARWLDAIQQRRPRSPGAYYNACRKNATRRSA